MRVRTAHRAGAAALVLLAATASGCDGGRADQRAGERAGGPEAAIDGLFDAVNANDPDRVLSHYHEGEDLVQVACTEVRRGYRQVAPIIRMWQEDQPETRIQHQVVRTLDLGRDAAVVAARGRNHQGLALFWTFVLRRDELGDWRIVQEHQSWADCREPRIHPMTE
jgi:ketosteroid isomerase-like protein